MRKIKIVFIQHQLVFGGAEKALYDLLCLLDKDKFDVCVYAQIPGGIWDEKFWNAGIGVTYEYSCRAATWNPLRKMDNLRKKWRIRQALANDGAGLMDICCPDADIIVSYSTWGSNQIGFGKNAKSVLYIHGNIETNKYLLDSTEAKREQIHRYDRIVCVSQEAKDAFCRWLGSSEGVETHYNPLNSQEVREKAREKVDLPDDLPIICAVGRLAFEKAFERLILIHKDLMDKGIRHRLVLVGDGPDQEMLERLIRATGTEETVTLVGYRENPYPYMKASKLLAISSYTEGLPVIAMEALSLGVPIVATIPAVAEIFGDENCGLITENSTSGLEAGIQKMLTDEAFYTAAKAGAEKRSSYFDGKRMVKEIEELFLELVKE